MTTPVAEGSSGAARNAANSLPSAAVRTRSSCEMAAPAIRGIGGSESRSKHMPGNLVGRVSSGAKETAVTPVRDYEYELRRDGTVIATGRLQRADSPAPGETLALGTKQVRIEDVLHLGTSRRLILVAR